jgi:hypothetical protein
MDLRSSLEPGRPLKYVDVITAAFAVTSVVSGVTAGKLLDVAGFVLPSSAIIFPLAYIFGDILTEVYGFRRSRRVIWIGFGCSIAASLIFGIAADLPSPSWFEGAPAYKTVLGQVPLIAVAGWLAFFLGEISNSIVLSVIKKLTKGWGLWLRAVASTMIGELVDTAIFLSIAFHSTFTTPQLINTIFTLYLWKVAVEVLFLPVTYAICRNLKRAEGVDVFDYGVKYNPFGFRGE